MIRGQHHDDRFGIHVRNAQQRQQNAVRRTAVMGLHDDIASAQIPEHRGPPMSMLCRHHGAYALHRRHRRGALQRLLQQAGTALH